ncbi:MAG: mycothiol synthase [Pseudonocardiales bacterium]|jgi:mycothiol synthase|nr:mycothiol synthase [Pseudonocardiales bacterium]
MSAAVARPAALDSSARAEVRALSAAVQHAVGQPPLSDQALTKLGDTDVRHVVMREGDRLVGYAQLAGTSVELAGDAAAVPGLLTALEPLPDGVEIWSHGKSSPTGPVLEARGYHAVRRLHQLRRPLDPLPPETALPDGVIIRPFVPGADDAAWLALNAAAFADLPDQGDWHLDDLQARQREDWFDPTGFLLADRDGDLLGFHWTKVHTAELGEVYVLGIHPAAQGMRLGSALLQRGLAYLAGRGCAEVLLYVDDANTAALRLYESAGFTRYDLDVLWGRTGISASDMS